MQKKWSNKYSQCKNPHCRHPKSAHFGYGLCKNCYGRWYRSKNLDKARELERRIYKDKLKDENFRKQKEEKDARYQQTRRYQDRRQTRYWVHYSFAYIEGKLPLDKRYDYCQFFDKNENKLIQTNVIKGREWSDIRLTIFIQVYNERKRLNDQGEEVDAGKVLRNLRRRTKNYQNEFTTFHVLG